MVCEDKTGKIDVAARASDQSFINRAETIAGTIKQSHAGDDRFRREHSRGLRTGGDQKREKRSDKTDASSAALPTSLAPPWIKSARAEAVRLCRGERRSLLNQAASAVGAQRRDHWLFPGAAAPVRPRR